MRFFGSIERSLEELIHAGTELDDISELIPAALPQAISDLRAKAASMLANGDANESAILEHWFEKQVVS